MLFRYLIVIAAATLLATAFMLPVTANEGGEPDGDRPIEELLWADEMTRSELNSVADHFGRDIYYEVADRARRIRIAEGDPELMVIGEALLEDETTLTFGETLLPEDVVVKGLIRNSGDEAALIEILSDEHEPAVFHLPPSDLLVIGEFVTDAATLTSKGCTCRDGYFACCWRNPGNFQPDCTCIADGTPATCPAGGPGATSCTISTTGCSVECGDGYAGCCWTDDSGRGHCMCVDINTGNCQGEPPNPGMSGCSTGGAIVVMFTVD